MKSSVDELDREQEAAYRREWAVEAQIANLAGLGTRRLLAALAAVGPDRVQEETLVHFLRQCHASGDGTSSGEIARLITGRVAGKLARLARVWRLGFPPDLTEDVIDEVLTDMYEQLFDNSPATAFWEARFWVCFNRRAINVMRKRRADLDQITADEDDDVELDDVPAEGIQDVERVDEPTTKAMISDAIGRLAQPVRTAFLLKHWSGYVEESADPSEPSIASIMGVTGRTVRNYLATAARQLERWRDEETNNG